MTFSQFAELWDHRDLIIEHSHHPKEKPPTHLLSLHSHPQENTNLLSVYILTPCSMPATVQTIFLRQLRLKQLVKDEVRI